MSTDSKPSSSSSTKAEAKPDSKKPTTTPTDDLDSLRKYWYPDRRGDIDEVARGYRATRLGGILPIPMRGWVFLAVSVAAVAVLVRNQVFNQVTHLVTEEMQRRRDDSIVGLGAFALLMVTIGYLGSLFYILGRRRPVYLVDFAVYTPPDELKTSLERFKKISRESGFFDEESLTFQQRLAERTGLGDETYLPPAILLSPPQPSMAAAREEAMMVIKGCCDDLFRKTGVSPNEVDVVIVNCSLFCPTPSLASMIINHYKMRKDVKNYNLGGMGCSAGAVSIDLAKDILQNPAYRSKNVLVFSTENITMNWYPGREKGMLISNTLFRMGGAAILLTNKFSWKWRSKYQLQTTVRVITACEDYSNKAIVQEEDKNGVRGVRISRDLVTCVGQALKTNLTVLGPQVLPYSEQLKFIWDFFKRRYLGKNRDRAPYTPNFKKAFQHYCIHAGGRAIIDGLEQNLQLSEYDVMPSRATLFRYGNTSSSSVWYELNYIERRGNVRKGDKVWQIAFGSGLKCNSAVWKALVDFEPDPDRPVNLSFKQTTTAEKDCEEGFPILI